MDAPRKLLTVLSEIDVPKVLRAISIVGAPVLISIWLIWVLTNNLVADVAATKAMISQHLESTAHMQVSLQEYFLEQRDRDKTVIALQRQQCVNTATDFQQRQACLQIQ